MASMYLLVRRRSALGEWEEPVVLDNQFSWLPRESQVLQRYRPIFWCSEAGYGRIK